MQTDASSFSLLPNVRKRSFYDQEDIEIKPSTELIPDEYKHASNNEVWLHIFKTDFEINAAEDLLESFQKIDYKLDPTINLHNLDTEKEFLEDLENIRRESQSKSALILIFIGFFDRKNPDGKVLMAQDRTSIAMKEIWSFFSTDKCPELKNKPKILIFCMSPEITHGVQTDSVRHQTLQFEQAYDFPAESDILVVYKYDHETIGTQKVEFLEQLCFNIEHYSKKYDIIDLVSYLYEGKVPPLVVSTLTRKFYLTPCTDRDHYLSLVENQTSLEESLRKLQDSLDKLIETKKKKKEKRFFSFRMKGEDKPKIAKKTEDKSKGGKKDEEKSKTDDKIKRISVHSACSKPNTLSSPRISLRTNSAVGVRSRNTSESDSARTKKKPIWKV